ncbi:MAG: FtsQ-type POTRA domain-containing protein [bacterium]
MHFRQKIRTLFRRRRRKTGEVEWLHANVPRRREHDGLTRWIVTGSVAFLLLLSAILFYVYHFQHNPQYLLRDLSIVSGATITDDLVRDVLQRSQHTRVRDGSKPGYLFGPDIEEVRAELMRLQPGIRSVSITRRLPSRMDVRIVEREPVGRIHDQVIDGDGVIFPRSVGVEHLPRIDGLEGIPVQAGSRLDGMGLAAVRLLSANLRPEYALPVAAVDVSRLDYIHLTLLDHRQVKLWWRGMNAAAGNESREALGKRLQILLLFMARAPQRQVWDATVPDDNRIWSPY